MRQQEESSDGSMKKSFADISFVCLLKNCEVQIEEQGKHLLANKHL